MKLTVFTLAMLSAGPCVAASPAKDVLVLTAENAKEQGYWVRCAVKDKPASTSAAPALVIFRLGLVHKGRLHPGPYGVNPGDLQIIKSMTLVVRDGDEELLRVPLPRDVDPGNEIHLLAEFSCQRKLVPGVQIVFEESTADGTRSVAVDLESFLAKR